jgi:hypothetical protein
VIVFFLEVTVQSENGSSTKRIALPLVSPPQLAGLQALVAAAFRLPLGAQMSIAILDGEDICLLPVLFRFCHLNLPILDNNLLVR